MKMILLLVTKATHHSRLLVALLRYSFYKTSRLVQFILGKLLSREFMSTPTVIIQ